MKQLLPLRYLIITMGFFAFYCGFIYNDFLSMNLDIFGSCYDPNPKNVCHDDQCSSACLDSKAGCYIQKHTNKFCNYKFGKQSLGHTLLRTLITSPASLDLDPAFLI